MTDEQLEEMREEVDELKDVLKETLGKVNNSNITAEAPISKDGGENTRNDPKSIWFLPTSIQYQLKYSALINTELQLRNMSTTGNLTEQHRVLKEIIGEEWSLNKLLNEIEACKRHEGALF